MTIFTMEVTFQFAIVKDSIVDPKNNIIIESENFEHRQNSWHAL